MKSGAVEGMLTAYYTKYDDLIVSRAPLPCPSDPRLRAGRDRDLPVAKRLGSAHLRRRGPRPWRFAAGWTARAAFSLPRGDDLSKDVPLNTIDPPRLVAGIGHETATWGAVVHATHAWEQTRVDRGTAGTFVPPAWTTVDITAWFKPHPSLELAAGLFNLTDEKYWLWSDVRGLVNVGTAIDRYTQPGRNFGVNARWSF